MASPNTAGSKSPLSMLLQRTLSISPHELTLWEYLWFSERLLTLPLLELIAGTEEPIRIWPIRQIYSAARHTLARPRVG